MRVFRVEPCQGLPELLRGVHGRWPLRTVDSSAAASIQLATEARPRPKRTNPSAAKADASLVCTCLRSTSNAIRPFSRGEIKIQVRDRFKVGLMLVHFWVRDSDPTGLPNSVEPRGTPPLSVPESRAQWRTTKVSPVVSVKGESIEIGFISCLCECVITDPWARLDIKRVEKFKRTSEKSYFALGPPTSLQTLGSPRTTPVQREIFERNSLSGSWFEHGRSFQSARTPHTHPERLNQVACKPARAS
ncbi:Hypothetical predicted protein [Olea europaea subsp. europaea]|uniref:Uncharacterized protein n=1 Tax=Olea europaea subsp. europaea TaxID=158383 RepID=A0A8S0QG34_OLEEU|nr:Hypothetical predicted protein [Olea europaea subsp. europaea]